MTYTVRSSSPRGEATAIYPDKTTALAAYAKALEDKPADGTVEIGRTP